MKYNNLLNEISDALLTDFYQLTMIQGYYYFKRHTEVVFDYFFRRIPFNGGYCIFAGLETLIDFINNFKFNDNDINYLKSLNMFKEDFLEFLRKLKFNIDLYSVQEGEIVFPNEPLIRIHGNIIEVQLLETILLNIINFQTLIATKTSRIVEAANGKPVLEFGLRRAQGIDGAISGTRASFIGGVGATSNVYSAKVFDIPPKGTMAHSWVMAFDSERESFEKYADLYPDSAVLLVDTYDSLDKGIPNAIKVLKALKNKGIKNFGIRIDSGDLSDLSKKARQLLDKAGLKEATVIVSNELDEYVISELKKNNSPIDVYGVGTKLITADGSSSLSGVYKIIAKKEVEKYKPCIKITDDPKKIINPGIKNILRLFKNNKPAGDLIFLQDQEKSISEKIINKKAIKLIHPEYDYKIIKIEDYDFAEILLKKVIDKGKAIIDFPSLYEIQQKVRSNLKKLDSRYKRLLNPHIYNIGISQELMDLKLKMINES